MITVIEPYRHSEVVNNIGVMLDYLAIPYRVIANEDVLQDIQELPCEKIKLTDYRPDKLNNKFCLVTTVTSYDYKLIEKLQGQKIVVVIHNTNHFFKHQENLVSPLSIQYIKTLIRHVFLRKKDRSDLILSKIAGYVTPEAWMIPPNGSNCEYLGVIPFSFTEAIPAQVNRAYTNIGIPGCINKHARDYLMLYQAIKNLQAINTPVVFHFLGNASTRSGKYWQQKFRSLTTKNVQFKFEPTYVSIETYNKSLENLDFMIVASKSAYPHAFMTEYYGQTNVTGAQSDMIRYAIPSLWVDHYPLSEVLEGISQRFTNANSLSGLIESWVNDRLFEGFNAERKNVHNEYRIEKQSKRLLSILT